MAFYFKQLEESAELKAYFMIVYYRCEFTDEFSSLLERHKAEYTIAKKEFSFFLQQIEVDSWVNKQVGDCDLIAEILVDALSGLIMRSLLSDEFKLSEQAIKTSKFILAGGGIRL
ncbi:hypothetical protein MHN01_15655 [Photobacterium sp. OFAV2-7]|nr:hypothetical protein [Photobacterium sp. OFAV2-7]